jgi:hypothetical protein
MKNRLALLLTLSGLSMPLGAVTYFDSTGDIDPGIANGNGTLDIVSMEVTNTPTDLVFQLTLNGNISTTDWGNFMIGISTGNTANTNTGNGWVRPIELNSPLGGMDYWVGSWVNSGGGSQLWTYTGPGGTGGTGNNWTGPSALGSYSFAGGTTSTINYSIPLASLGLAVDDTFYFDAYSSGGGGGDSAVDSLANPNVSITAWDQAYTSSTPSPGLYSYTVVPEASHTMLVLAGLAAFGWRRRR